MEEFLLASDINHVFFCQGATWDPDGHIILIAFSGSLTLGSIHFSSKPPSLGMQAGAFKYFSLIISMRIIKGLQHRKL
jgi:hypothetical protein